MDRGIVPAREHVVGRFETDRVVHNRRPAYAASLENGEAEVFRLLAHTVGVELADHLDLVLTEGARLYVKAALNHQNTAPSFGEVSGQRGAGDPAYDV